MTYYIHLSDEDRKVVASYAESQGISVAKAFKNAFFSMIKDEYDINLAEKPRQDK